MLLARVEVAIDDLQVKRADLDHTLKELRKIRAACVEHLSAEDPEALAKCKG
jgi:uncharacterized protein YoxC